MKSKKVILTCAITGSIHTPTMSPYLPITPEDIARESIAAAKAGAAVLHLHARNPSDGRPSFDPQVFRHPDAIDLSRPRKHLAFGRGIHTCVGAPLARLEAKVVIETLLERTTSFKITEHMKPVWAESLQMRRHDYLPITLNWR